MSDTTQRDGNNGEKCRFKYSVYPLSVTGNVVKWVYFVTKYVLK